MVDAKITIKNITTLEQEVCTFVSPYRAKRLNNTRIYLEYNGLVLVGCKVGDIVRWNFW